MGQQKAIPCPKGWILTGWNVYQPGGQRILYQGSSAFISVHPVKKSFITTEKVICNNDARRWTQME
ncbi:MAG TPA: hypothetical protein PKM17_09490 [Syntrophorhabdus sp.]|nr:hypothetical protein [Syntrophorhabdus sp.]